MSQNRINISAEYLNNVLQCFAAAVDTQEVTNPDSAEIDHIIQELEYDLDRMWMETCYDDADSDERCNQLKTQLIESARYYLENRILK